MRYHEKSHLQHAAWPFVKNSRTKVDNKKFRGTKVWKRLLDKLKMKVDIFR